MEDYIVGLEKLVPTWDDSLTDSLKGILGGVDINAAIAVRSARNNLGWSQAKLASMMHVLGYPWYQATVNRVESQKSELTLREWLGLLIVFGSLNDTFLGQQSVMD